MEKSISHKVTFRKKGGARTGNILFQYLFCKLISLKFGHVYEPVEEYCGNQALVITDENCQEFCQLDALDRDVICDGYFQMSELYNGYRNELINSFGTDKWIGFYGNNECIADFLTTESPVKFEKHDLVISLQLDDFIHTDSPTSNLVPPEFYLEQIDNWISQYGKITRMYIVCDKIRHPWETKYLQYFSPWNPIVLQNSLLVDFAMMRDAPNLIHSNSTLCWFASFCSTDPSKHRIIPHTGFYRAQKLKKISPEDIQIDVVAMTHHQVENLNAQQLILGRIHPLSYSIPDELIVNTASSKSVILADLIPGQIETYRFGVGDEAAFHKMYREARFAYTCKRGGWDCLRHYEILAAGCIPIFKDLDKCPKDTMINFPKDLVKESNKFLLPWKDNQQLYYDYQQKLLDHTRNHCSTSATAKYFLEKTGQPQKVLLISCHMGVNYTRETLWIGLKREIEQRQGIALEYPRLDFLYQDYQGPMDKLHGNGFTYTKRLNETIPRDHDDIVEKIKTRFWDLIIYGKIGPDEGPEGSYPNLPFWSEVYGRYNSKEIVFLYGGDECIDLTSNNRYSQHILFHGQFGKCFVRELRR